MQTKKEERIVARSLSYNLICLLLYNFLFNPPSLASTVDAKQVYKGVDVVHGGHAVTAPQSFKLTIADSRHDSVIASQFNVAVLPLDYLCLAVKGLSTVVRLQFVCVHDVRSLSCIGIVWCSVVSCTLSMVIE